MIRKILRYLVRFFLSADPVVADATNHLSNKEYYEIDGFRLAQVIKRHAGKRVSLEINLIKSL
jgi:hypothetical protein